MALVVVLGSSNTDMTVRLPHLPAPGQTVLGGSFATGQGGKGSNQALAARRAGAEVVFVTAVGDDPLGREALAKARDEGIDVSHAMVVPTARSGVALIFVADSGENMIGVAPGANAELDPAAIDRLPDALFPAGGLLLAGLEVPLGTVVQAVRRAHRAGMRVVLNPAPADRALLDVDILRFVDVITPNQVEVAALADRPPTSSKEGAAEAARELIQRGAGAVVVTLGDQGCLIVERGATTGPRRTMIAARPVAVVDTVGAGDAFNGALATALAEGRPLVEAAAWANAAAALAVTRPGAQAALPDRAAIDRLAATVRTD